RLACRIAPARHDAGLQLLFALRYVDTALERLAAALILAFVASIRFRRRTAGLVEDGGSRGAFGFGARSTLARPARRDARIVSRPRARPGGAFRQRTCRQARAIHVPLVVRWAFLDTLRVLRAARFGIAEGALTRARGQHARAARPLAPF